MDIQVLLSLNHYEFGSLPSLEFGSLPKAKKRHVEVFSEFHEIRFRVPHARVETSRSWYKRKKKSLLTNEKTVLNSILFFFSFVTFLDSRFSLHFKTFRFEHPPQLYSLSFRLIKYIHHVFNNSISR